MKIRVLKIGDPKDGGQYIMRECDDFEYVNPIHHFVDSTIGLSMSFDRDLLKLKGYVGPDDKIEQTLFKRATKLCEEEIKKLKSIKIPEELITLLQTNDKKKQIKLLKNLTLTSNEFLAFIIHAYNKFGYTYSQYKASHHHEGIDTSKLPAVIHIEDSGEVHTIGSTPLTKGQLKQVVEHRKVIVSKFLDKGDIWHCFFLTFKSLDGKENYHNGQPHLHYISSAWNIPRQDVKEQLTSKKYSLPSLPHIDFHTHRNPRE